MKLFICAISIVILLGCESEPDVLCQSGGIPGSSCTNVTTCGTSEGTAYYEWNSTRYTCNGLDCIDAATALIEACEVPSSNPISAQDEPRNPTFTLTTNCPFPFNSNQRISIEVPQGISDTQLSALITEECSARAPEAVTIDDTVPSFFNPFTNMPVEITRAEFTEEDFFLNGRIWSCVESRYGERGDFWSFIPGSKGALHYANGTADTFDNVNANISAADTGLPWSVTDGVYSGPLALDGVEWVEQRGDARVSVWVSDNLKFECAESSI